MDGMWKSGSERVCSSVKVEERAPKTAVLLCSTWGSKSGGHEIVDKYFSRNKNELKELEGGGGGA